MTKYVADKDGHWIPLVRTTSESHFVQGDIDFMSPDGKHIGSRSEWRDHLKRTGTIEMGHSDMKSAREKHMKQTRDIAENEKHAAKVGIQTEYVEHRDEIQERDKTRIDKEVANRLHNRPLPELPQLIKLTLETARDLARRR